MKDDRQTTDPVLRLSGITKTFPGVTALSKVELALYPGQVTALVGEIDPWQVETAVVTQFTYALRPTVGLDDPGFDHLEISAKGGRLVSIDGVRIGEFDDQGSEVELVRFRHDPPDPRLRVVCRHKHVHPQSKSSRISRASRPCS